MSTQIKGCSAISSEDRQCMISSDGLFCVSSGALRRVEGYTSENGDLWRKVENLETANRCAAALKSCTRACARVLCLGCNSVRLTGVEGGDAGGGGVTGGKGDESPSSVCAPL